jgi:hypothetical protein
VFSFEALHLLLNASMGTLLLLQRCCLADQGFAEASTAHIFIKIAPILHSRIAASAEMLNAPVLPFDANVSSSDLAAQVSAIQAYASCHSAADAAVSHRSQLFADLLARVHKEPYTHIVPGELLNLSTVSLSRTRYHLVLPFVQLAPTTP